jgi:hypothetical protein
MLSWGLRKRLTDGSKTVRIEENRPRTSGLSWILNIIWSYRFAVVDEEVF